MTDGPKTFLQRIAERNGGATTGPQAPPTVVGVSVTGDGSPYGLKALREEASLVASATEGTRNHTLNRAAFKLASLVDAGHLPPGLVNDTLTGAARTAGLPDAEIRATLASGRRGSAAKVGARQVPETPENRPNVIEVTAGQFADTHGDDAFWSARESLKAIYDYALACMVSPWGLLGAISMYALDAIPYHVGLPGLAGDDALGSLNAFVALVAASGGSKGRTIGVARRYVGRSDFDVPPGSGEGLVKTFVQPLGPKKADIADGADVIVVGGDAMRIKRRNVVLNIPEVDNLAALGTRNGATLPALLRQAFSGETLGFAYADDTKRAFVPGGEYRLTMLVGVQPERAAALLDDAAGGTPQRFAWLPVTDSRISRTNRPARSEPHPIASFDCWRSTSVFEVCERAREEIEVAAEARAQGLVDALDGHALFVRLKMAAALAVIDSRVSVTDEDWRLSGILMAVSDATRQSCVNALRAAQERANEARGRSEGVRMEVSAEAAHTRRLDRVAGVLVRAVVKHGATSKADLRSHRVASRDRDLFDEALALAVECGQLTVDGEEVAVP